MKTPLAYFALALALVAPVAAQQPADLTPGARVRIVSDQHGLLAEGTLVRLGADTAVVSDGVRQQPFGLGGDRRLELRRRVPRSGAWAGAGKGAWKGAVVGGAWAGLTLLFCDGWECLGAAIFPPLCTVAGAMYGAIRGTTSREVWLPVATSGLSVGVSAQPGGRLGLGAALNF